MLDCDSSLDLGDGLRVAVALSDAAHVDATLNLEETLVAPLRAPRVLDQPVVKSRVSVVSVSNSEHGMIDIVGAVLALS